MFASPIVIADALPVLAVVLLATLAGTAATLYALFALLRPVSLTSKALRRYLDDNKMPDLPTGFDDKAGRLMADVQYALEHLDNSLRSLEELSTKDHLTNTYNRRGGEEMLAADLARIRRSGDQLTVALMDMDQFKSINDRHGHQTGDLCLNHVASIVRRNIREGDWLARWGGDEFLLVMRETGEERLPETVFERITEDLARNPVVLPQGEEIRLTLSSGGYRGIRGSKDTLQDIVARADRALNRA